jgi:hypothetical protein
MALVGWVAAWHATGRTHMSGHHPQPTTRRQRLARVGRIAAATVVIAAGCLAGIVAVPANPPTPPPGILFPLPDGLRPTRVSYSCGPIGAQCLWSTVVEADDEASDRLVYELETHLTRTKGWHLATSRCRTWGWVIKERACVTIARPPILIMVSGPPPRPGCTRTDAWPS